MERRQRPMSRSREEGTRFDFRLHFQASGISKSEWDGLILSMVSIGTGRIAAKTPRVLVRDGCCIWPEPIMESTKLAPDPLTGKYAEKLYKIIIQTGQVSILGDATINLSDYVDAKSQISISLPLRNCNADTLLHVNVQCLTPRIGSRELHWQRVGNNDQDYYGSVSEDNSSNSDASENFSAASPPSQNMSVWTNGSHNMKRGSTGSSSSKDGHPKIDVIPAHDASNGNANSYLGLNGSRSFTAVSQKLEIAEITIQKLQEEVSLREQWAQKVLIEVGSLKQQLISELKNVDDLKVEILAKNAECDGLRSQLEQQKHFRAAPMDYHSRWGAEDSRRQIDTLQDEIVYLKQMNVDLQLRLNKTNDSNVEFISLVQDLENSLNVKDAEFHKLEETNKTLLAKLAQLQDSQRGCRDADANNMMHDASHWQQNLRAAETLLIDKEQEIKLLKLKLESQMVALDGDHATENMLHMEIGISDTSKNDVSLSERLESLADNEATDKRLEVLLSDVNNKNDVLEARMQNMMNASKCSLSKLEIEKGDLQKKLDESQYEVRSAKEKLELLMQELETLKNTVDFLSDSKIKLERGNRELLDEISQLKKMNMGLLEKVSNLDAQLTNVKNERDSYKQELEIKREIESSHSLLEKQLQDKTSECIQMQERIEDQARQHQNELDLKESELHIEMQSLLNQKNDVEHRAILAEQALSVLQKEKDQEIDRLKNALDHLTPSIHEKEKMKLETLQLHLEKTNLENSLKKMEEALKNLENKSLSERMASNIEVNEISKKLDVSVKSCEFLTEKLELLQQQLEIQEKEKMDFLHKIDTLEEVQDKVAAFSIMEQKLLEAHDVAERSKQLQERFKELEDDAKATKEQLITREREFAVKETELCHRIECLESANEQLAAGMVDSGVEQLKHELIRLQNQNSFLAKREQELVSAMRTQKILEEEVTRLQECNDLLETRLLKLVGTAKNPLLLEKVVNLETELAEVVEASNMYKQQLMSVLDKQQNDQLQVEHYEKENTKLQEELHKIHERYTIVSLKLAETEAEKSELQLRIRKNVKLNSGAVWNEESVLS